MSHQVGPRPQVNGVQGVNDCGMHLGRWFRRIAAAMVLTLGLGLAAGDGTALGLELPATEPALGAEALPGTPELPPTPVVPIDPRQLIGPTVPPTAISPPGPTGPSGPSGSPAAPSGSATGAQSSVSRTRRGNLQSTGRTVRNVVNGDRASTPGAAAAGAKRARRAPARTRERGEPQRQELSPSSRGFQVFHPSSLEHLGEVLAGQASPPRFLGGFSASATGSADWAPPLLTILFLIGLGGFLRVAISAPRRQL
jgi:hypothetical protein